MVERSLLFFVGICAILILLCKKETFVGNRTFVPCNPAKKQRRLPFFVTLSIKPIVPIDFQNK